MDTGLEANTGGRLRRLKAKLGNETFMLTYGDGVCSVPIDELVRFHKSHGRIATVTAVRPASRFGGLEIQGDQVVKFSEKPQIGEGWINGGFMVLEPEVFDYLDGGDAMSLEADAMERIAAEASWRLSARALLAVYGHS